MFLNLIIVWVIIGFSPSNSQNNPTDKMILLARKEYANQNYMQAIAVLDKIIQKNDNCGEALYLQGLNYTQLKKFDTALELLHKALTLRPEKTFVYNDIGIVYYYKKQYDIAEKWFKKSLKISNINYKALYNLGNIYYVKKEYKEALKWYTLANAIDKTNKDILFYMANCWSILRDYHHSIELYERILTLGGESDTIYHYLALDYMYLKEYRNVKKYYKKGIGMNRNNFHLYVNLFEIELIQNIRFDQQKVDQFKKVFLMNKEAMMKYDMLKNLQKLSIGEDVNLSTWEAKYRDGDLGKWNFSLINEWIEKEQNIEYKRKLLKAVNIFKKYKK